jgi:hypothetical protein
MEIKGILEEYSYIIEGISKYDPIKMASAFAVMLTKKELQSNCLRLEALVHVCLLCCKGYKNPTQKIVMRLYTKFGEGYFGMMEDPAEDVFVSLVTTPVGSFRIFEGLWESAAYYLQRVLNVIENMPDIGPYVQFKRSVVALLRLSDAVACRVNVDRYTLGNENTVASLPLEILSRLKDTRSIAFHISELSRYDIDIDGLVPFMFTRDMLDGLSYEEIGHSTLERRPLVRNSNHIYVLLPSSISVAIRRCTFEFVKYVEMEKVFEAELAREYMRHFLRHRVLDLDARMPISFVSLDGAWNASVMFEFDAGRYLHLEFVMDGLSNFEKDGFLGVNENLQAIENIIEVRINKAIEAAKQSYNYKGGLSIIVFCGYGRGLAFRNFEVSEKTWRIEYVAANSLQILKWTKDFSLSSLWRILEERDKLEKFGVYLSNVNGLLNLVAWTANNNGHLIPHDQMPSEAGEEGRPLQIMIDQNALRGLRHDFYIKWDPHRELSPEGKQVLLYKNEPSIFDDDSRRPLYVSLDSLEHGDIRAVYKSEKRTWWCSIRCSEKYDSRSYYQHWEMLQEWMARTVPVVEVRVNGLPDGPISWVVMFDTLCDDGHEVLKPSRDQIGSNIAIFVDIDSKLITMNIEKEFMGAFRYPDNVAEKAIVGAFVSGVMKLSSAIVDNDLCEEIVNVIVPDEFARHLHYFDARNFRDFVNSLLPSKQIVISKSDDASTKLGLGWRVRSREEGNKIYGKSECTAFLNDLVQDVELEICSVIKGLDRKQLILKLIANIEKISAEQDRWRYTSRAVLSMHGESELVFSKISEILYKLNGASLASRLLIEVAVCEAPLAGGKTPGRIDLSLLMALILTTHYVGGWSDAIHRDAMEPFVFITPLGDVQVNHEFIDSIIAPFGRVGNDEKVRNNAADCSKYYMTPSIRSSVEDSFDKFFWEAWKDELGASLDDVRKIMDILEDWAIHEKQVPLVCKKSELISRILQERFLDEDSIKRVLDAFTLYPRMSWKAIPEGFIDADRQPWRFRRRLSHIRRPFVQLNVQDDPTIAFSPGFVRDSIVYVLSNYHDGSFPESQAQSKIMRKWIGRTSHNRGVAFNSEVANRLRELGWLAKSDIKVTHLLGKGFDRDYGDIDVLAWRPMASTVLLIECKDLQYHKTIGEIAEQLSDFKGEIKSNGKPDLLKKHLDRVELIKLYPAEVAKFLEVESINKIEGRIVFKNPVPMQFAWSQMKKNIPLFLFNELDAID